MATVKIAYAASVTIACTIAGLASSTTVGRSSAAVDNTINLYDDALLFISTLVSGTTQSMDKSCYVYVYGSEDGTNYLGSSGEAAGTDIPVTFNNPTNLKGPIIIACPGTSQAYSTSFAVGQFFGGRLPRKWGFVVRNFTGNTIDPNESSHIKSYTGITYTVA